MPKIKHNRPMTDRQRRFVEEYLVDCNAAAAAVRAGYSEKSARRTASELKTVPVIQAALKAAMETRQRRLGVDQDRVVTELARIAFADIRDFVSWDDAGVRLRPSAELTAEQTACVAEIVETAGKGVRVKLHGKIQALSALSRHVADPAQAEAATGPRPITVLSWIPEPDLPPDEPPDGGTSCSPR